MSTSSRQLYRLRRWARESPASQLSREKHREHRLEVLVALPQNFLELQDGAGVDLTHAGFTDLEDRGNLLHPKTTEVVAREHLPRFLRQLLEKLFEPGAGVLAARLGKRVGVMHALEGVLDGRGLLFLEGAQV